MVARRRSLIFKVLLLIPAVWFCALLLFAVNGGNQQAAVDDRPAVGGAKQDDDGKGNHINEIQGFGPPIGHEIPESIGGDPNKKKDEGGDANLPKPKKFVVDPNSPIYKSGDPSQVGEMGKAVTINKNVSLAIFVSLALSACSLTRVIFRSLN